MFGIPTRGRVQRRGISTSCPERETRGGVSGCSCANAISAPRRSIVAAACSGGALQVQSSS